MFSAKSINRPAEISLLLSCRRLPGRLTTGETAVVLGFQEHDIAVLVASRLLKPLGNPALNGTKYFAAVDVLTVASDSKWLSKATHTLHQYWKNKNARKSTSTQL
jgi:hypothetical protein